MPFAKIEPSGCCERYGVVQVRLDMFLEEGNARWDDPRFYVTDWNSPEALAGYKGLVDKEDYPLDWEAYNAWADDLPKIWLPERDFHTHMVYFDPYTLRDEDIEAAINRHLPNFYKAWIDEWDKVQGGMRHGWDIAFRKPRPIRYNKTQPELYSQRRLDCLAKVEILKASNFAARSTGIGEIFPSTDITAGAAAINRGSTGNANYTLLSLDVPATGTGTIDTIEVWAASTLYNLEVATFIDEGSNNYSTRDNETIGTVTSGAKRTFTGLDMDVETDDLLGGYYSSGTIERDTSGYAGIRYDATDQIPCTSNNFPDYLADDAMSLYGTGETAGGIDYPISTTCGLTASATIDRDVAWDRGMAPGLTISAAIAIARGWLVSTITNLTASVAVSRFMTYTRATTAGLTASATVVKGWGRSITTSVGLTVSATVSKAVAFHRAIVPGLTASVTIVKTAAYHKAVTAGLTISATIIKGWGRAAIAITTNLTASVTIAKALAYKRAVSSGLTASATIVRTLAYHKAITAGLTASAAVVRVWGRTIVTSPGLTISATVSRAVAYHRAVQAGLVISVSIVADAIKHYLISVVANLAISASVARSVAYHRALQPALTISTTIARSWNRTIVTPANLAISVTIDRTVAYHRAISSGLTIAVSIVRVVGRTIATNTNLAVSVTISRVVAYHRAIQPGLSVAVTILRKLAYNRAISPGLSISAIILRTIAKNIVTSANLTISVTIRICTVLRELLRVPISRLASIRLPISRLSRWRKVKKCSDD